MNIYELIKQISTRISAEDLICAAGLVILGIWLLRTSFGRKALINTNPRRNNMPAYLPFIPLFIWFGVVSITIFALEKMFPDLPDWQNVLLDNIVLCAGAILAMIITLNLVKNHFVNRLEGFGLAPKTIPKDFFFAIINLLSIWPIVLMAIITTIFLGEYFYGPDFRIPQHQELESLITHTQISVRIMIITTTIIVVPVFEEMLFRGLFQSMIRAFIIRPWLSILISSAIFAAIHANIAHWPALLILGICMGYSYEKSGSLFRPIFIHALFNAAGILAALNQ